MKLKQFFSANSTSVFKLYVYGLYVIGGGLFWGFLVVGGGEASFVFGPNFILSYPLEASADCSQITFCQTGGLLTFEEQTFCFTTSFSLPQHPHCFLILVRDNED